MAQTEHTENELRVGSSITVLPLRALSSRRRPLESPRRWHVCYSVHNKFKFDQFVQVFCLNGVKNITVARIILTVGLLWFKMERRMTLSGHVPSLSLIPLGTCHSGKYYIDGECLGKHSPYQFIYFSLLKEIIKRGI
jgi:hypothetical protein